MGSDNGPQQRHFPSVWMAFVGVLVVLKCNMKSWSLSYGDKRLKDREV
jgi:hypothetical protein